MSYFRMTANGKMLAKGEINSTFLAPLTKFIESTNV